MRLDKLIAGRYGLSRRAATEAVRSGKVDVDGRCCLEPGQEVTPETPLVYDPNRPRPGVADRHLHVLYEDRHILIVDKPAGLLTQPTQDRERDTLLERAGRYLSRKHGIKNPYVGIVHRLDQDTSGTILLVTAARSLRPFQAMFRDHAIERVYLAVVEGVFLTPSGRIDLPIIPDRGDGRRSVARGATPGALDAVTHFEVLETFGQAASLLACRLETGRTHQIRIHLAEIGHPVLGDRVYRPYKAPGFPLPVHRQALHAQRLGFVHPITGETVVVEAPVPADFEELLSRLRREWAVSSRQSLRDMPGPAARAEDRARAGRIPRGTA
jgi:23S rRNA pseudouridine1911/1915/1917 synthase